jgi:hypothetical protein
MKHGLYVNEDFHQSRYVVHLIVLAWFDLGAWPRDAR